MFDPIDSSAMQQTTLLSIDIRSAVKALLQPR